MHPTSDTFTAVAADQLRRELARRKTLSWQTDRSLLSPWLSLYALPKPDAATTLELCQLNIAEFQIVTARWQRSDAKATALVVHGYFDHIGMTRHLIRHLLNQRYSVVAFDLPGHGLSSGPRAEIEDFQQYVDVMDGVISHHQLAGTPGLWAIGQSTGGAILMKKILQGDGRELFDRTTALVPLLYPNNWSLVKLNLLWVKRALKALPRLDKKSSHDEAFNQLVKEGDPLQPKTIPVNWLLAMQRWAEQFQLCATSDVPIHIIQGSGDHTLEWRTNLNCFRSKFPNARISMVEDGKHHMINEAEPYLSEILGLVGE